MTRLSSKAAWAGIGFLVFGVVSMLYAEDTSAPNPFSHSAKAWNIWHYVALTLFTVSAALFLVWYRPDGKDD